MCPSVCQPLCPSRVIPPERLTGDHEENFAEFSANRFPPCCPKASPLCGSWRGQGRAMETLLGLMLGRTLWARPLEEVPDPGRPWGGPCGELPLLAGCTSSPHPACLSAPGSGGVTWSWHPLSRSLALSRLISEKEQKPRPQADPVPTRPPPPHAQRYVADRLILAVTLHSLLGCSSP